VYLVESRSIVHTTVQLHCKTVYSAVMLYSTAVQLVAWMQLYVYLSTSMVVQLCPMSPTHGTTWVFRSYNTYKYCIIVNLQHIIL
jgi:hypothetical protein